MNRLKRIIWTIEDYSGWLKDLKNFTYPLYSYLFYALALIFLLVFDADYMPQWILAFFIAILLFTNPNCQIYASELIDILNFREEWENLKSKLYQKNPLLPQDFSKLERKQSGGMLYVLGMKSDKN